MRRKNKKAWIKIVEAFIAIVLITSVLLFVYTKTVSQPKKTERIYELEKSILQEIAFNKELRTKVLEKNESAISSFVEERIENIFPGFDFSIKICEPEEICNLPFYEKEVFSNENIISSNLTDFSPKKLKIFVWRES